MKGQDLRLLGLLNGEVYLGPETIHIDITNGCNTNCITCWDHSPLLTIGRKSEWKRERVSLSRVQNLLGDALSLGGLKAVILSGMGEPFTHPEIYEMIEAVKSHGLHLTIITNLIPARAQRLVELDVDQLLIGIHGATESSYRAFHPSFQSDEWQRLHKMLEAFVRAGKHYKHVHVICRVNAEELVEMVDLGHTYQAAQINFKLAGLKDGTEAARITEEQRTLLRQELIPRAVQRAEQLGVLTNLDVFATQVAAGDGDTAPIDEVGCFMGHYYTRVLVDGTVLYCCNTEVKIGNLAEAPLSSLFHGETWQKYRSQMRRGEYLDSCRQCGKFNQNVTIGKKFKKAYGEAALRKVLGKDRGR